MKKFAKNRFASDPSIRTGLLARTPMTLCNAAIDCVVLSQRPVLIFNATLVNATGERHSVRIFLNHSRPDQPPDGIFCGPRCQPNARLRRDSCSKLTCPPRHPHVVDQTHDLRRGLRDQAKAMTGNMPALGSIGFDWSNKVRNPEEALTNPPNTIGAQKKFGRVVHVSKLQMISVCDDVD